MPIKNFAQDEYGTGGGGVLIPRQKFNFKIEMDIFDRSTANEFWKISNVTSPSYSFDTTIMNQYNKKRVVQSKMNYDPITITFYDTFDNQWQYIMEDYIAHYYHGGNGIDRRRVDEGSSTVETNFVTDMGYTLTADRYFFRSISIYNYRSSNEYRKTILKNPIITTIQGDTLDYSDSNPVQYTVTFQPESVNVYDVPGRGQARDYDRDVAINRGAGIGRQDPVV